MKNYDLVIIGGGSAGMAAAIKAHELGIQKILLIEKNAVLGGILNQCIHNGFGLTEFKEELTGPEFIDRFVKQLAKLELDILLQTTVTKISQDKVIDLVNQKGYSQIKAQAVIFAVGCYERPSGTIKLPGDRPKGVLTAGQAQYYQNILGQKVGKRVFILGSGDIGLIMARRLTLEGSKVLGVAEIMPYSNGLNRNIVQCLNDYQIPLFLSHTVSKVIGKERLEKIIVSQVDAKLQIIPHTEKEYEVDTLILSVGLVPNLEVFTDPAFVTSSTRGLLVNNHLEASVPGVFSCGNCLHVHDLVDQVVIEAREAALNAYNYLHNINCESYPIKVKKDPLMGYLIPESLDLCHYDELITFKFRVKRPMLRSRISLFDEKGELIHVFTKLYMIPSEMISISVKRELIANCQELSFSFEVFEE